MQRSESLNLVGLETYLLPCQTDNSIIDVSQGDKVYRGFKRKSFSFVVSIADLQKHVKNGPEHKR